MVRLNRIYTKAGDGGDTRLVGGQKVRKDALRIEAYGTVDELSACIGIARTALLAPDAPAGADALAAVLARVQNELFNLGSDLATLPADRHPKQPVIEARHVTALEHEIDAWNESLPELRSFVLPGGGMVAAYLHLARTVCRRAERMSSACATPSRSANRSLALRQPPVGRAVRHEPPRRAPVRRARAALGTREDLSRVSGAAAARTRDATPAFKSTWNVNLVKPSSAFVPNVSANAGLRLYMMPAPAPTNTGPDGTVSMQVWLPVMFAAAVPQLLRLEARSRGESSRAHRCRRRRCGSRPRRRSS